MPDEGSPNSIHPWEAVSLNSEGLVTGGSSGSLIGMAIQHNMSVFLGVPAVPDRTGLLEAVERMVSHAFQQRGIPLTPRTPAQETWDVIVALLSNWPDDLSNEQCLSHAQDTLHLIGGHLDGLRPGVERTPGGASIRHEPTISVRIPIPTTPVEYVPTNVNFNVTMSKTKVHTENLIGALKVKPVDPSPPKKSIWDWLRDPAV